MKVNQCNSYINIIMGKTHTHRERERKHLTKPNTLLVKILNELGIEDNFLKPIKHIYDKPTEYLKSES